MRFLRVYNGATEGQPCPPHVPLPLSGIQSDLDRQLKEQQWEVLCQIIGDKTAFVFGKQGCLTDTEMHTALKVGVLSLWGT